LPTAKGKLNQRNRLITWEYPAEKSALAMSGLEYLYAVKAGQIPPPPVWNLVDCRLVEIKEGHIVFELNPSEHHYNRFGRVQGGVLCVVLDATMASTLSSALPIGMNFTSPELKINYFRPITSETGTIRCEGSIIHKGNRIAILEAKIVDNEGKLYANAMSTFMIYDTTKDENQKV